MELYFIKTDSRRVSISESHRFAYLDVNLFVVLLIKPACAGEGLLEVSLPSLVGPHFNPPA